MSSESPAIIGGGAWGTALAIHLAKCGAAPRLWIREDDLVQRMLTRRDNPVYLPGIPVPEAVMPVGSISEAVEGASLLLAVVPSQYARGVYREIAASIDGATPVVVAAKGIEESSLALPLEAASQELGQEQPLAILSGPSFAAELARGTPTVVVIASESAPLSSRLQESLSGGALRIYTSDDPTGVQLAGALKNVIAIAAGIADGLGMGANAQAALITRGLAEIARLGEALGGRAATFAGLAGMGDLVLTCTGGASRNRTLGQRLGRGERLSDIVGSTPSVAEGVRTTRSALALARRERVEMPIVEELHRILFEEGTPQDALASLMARPLTTEERR